MLQLTGDTVPRVLVMPQSAMISAEALFAEIGSDKEDQLKSIREMYREGHRAQAARELISLRDAESFSLLSVELRGEILGTLAIYSVNVLRDLDCAARYIGEAEAIGAVPTRARAVLAYHQSGGSDALEILGAPASIPGFHLRLSLLLELGRLSEFDTVLATAEPRWKEDDAELFRLLAIRAVLGGDLGTARLEIQRAVSRRPKWRQVRLVSGITDLLSTVHVREDSQSRRSMLPQIFDWVSIRDDDESRMRRKAAQEMFSELVTEISEEEREWAQMVRMWWLASLINERTSQDDAAKLARSFLRDGVAIPQVLFWMFLRGYEVDQAVAQEALAAFEAAHGATVDAVSTLICLELARGQPSEALTLLREGREAFLDAERSHDWYQLFSQAAALAAHWDEMQEAIEKLESEAQVIASLHALSLDGLPIDVETALFQRVAKFAEETDDSELSLVLAHEYARRSRWDDAVVLAVPSAREVATRPAIELTASVLYEVRRHRECLEFLLEMSRVLPGGSLTPKLQRIRISCEWELGLLQSATSTADQIASLHRDASSLLLQMETRLLVGDLAGVVQAARELRSVDATTVQLLSASRIVEVEDRALARALWRKATALDIESATVRASAGSLGLTLGLIEQALPLLRDLEADEAKAAGVWVFHGDPVEQFSRLFEDAEANRERWHSQYLCEELPAHGLAHALGIPLIAIYAPIVGGSDPVRAIDCIVLSPRSAFNIPKVALVRGNLRLDISSICVLWLVGQLENTERQYGPLKISRFTLMALVQQLASIQSNIADPTLQQLQSPVRSLIAHLRLGCEDGTYVFVEGPKVELDGVSESSLELRQLHDILSTPSESAETLIVADACLARFAPTDGTKIVGIFGFLSTLRTEAKLEPETYFRILDVLRTADAVQIPVEAEEIVFWLSQANTGEDGSLAESAALARLRIYVASRLLDERRHDGPPSVASVSATRAGLGAIHALWATRSLPTSRVIACSNWIIESLYFGLAGALDLHGLREHQRPGIVAADLGHMLAGSLPAFVPNEDHGADGRGTEFFRWASDKLLDWRLLIDSTIARDVGAVLVRLFERQLDTHEPGSPDRALFAAFMGLHFLALPEPIADSVANHKSLASELGITRYSLINLGRTAFERSVLIPALARTAVGDFVAVPVHESEVDVQVRVVDQPSWAIEIDDGSGGESQRIEDDFYGVLVSNADSRLDILGKNAEWFDGPGHESAAREIAVLQDPMTLAERVFTMRADSAALYYAHISANLVGGQFSRELILPRSRKGLLRHYFFTHPTVADLVSTLESVGKLMIKELGLTETVIRLSGLPRELPSCVLRAIADLDESQQLSLWDHILDRTACPMARIHVARCCSGKEGAGFRQRLDAAIDEVLHTDADKQFELFSRTLGLVQRELFLSAKSEAWSIETLLCLSWQHASRLFDLFMEVGAHPTTLSEWLADTTDRIRHLDVFIPWAQADDLAFSRWISRPNFVVRSLAWALAPAEASLSDEQAERCRVIAQDPRLGSLPDRSLLRDPTCRPDKLGVPWAEAKSVALCQVVGKIGAEFSGENLGQVAKDAIAHLGHELEGEGAWFLLSTVLAGGAPDDSCSSGLVEVIRRVCEGELDTSNSDVRMAGLAVACEYASTLLTVEEQEKLATVIVDLARDFHDNGTDDMTPERAVECLLGLASHLMMRGPSSIPDLVPLLERVLGAWPGAAQHLTPLASWPLRVPVDYMEGTWTAALLIRKHLSPSA